MRINSKNMFPRIVSKENRLNSIEKRVLLKEQRLIEKEQKMVNTVKFFQTGFEKGLQQGKDEGIEQGKNEGFKLGYKQGYEDGESDAIEPREYGGPVTKGKPYLVGEAGVEGFMPKFPIPDLPGLGGGGGGTDSITDKAKTKSLGKKISDVGKILTFPFSRRNIQVDPTENFASEYVEADSSNNEFGNITSSMTNKPRVQTVVQPVIQTQTRQVPVPMPMGSSTQVIKTTKSKLPPSIAKMIN